MRQVGIRRLQHAQAIDEDCGIAGPERRLDHVGALWLVAAPGIGDDHALAFCHPDDLLATNARGRARVGAPAKEVVVLRVAPSEDDPDPVQVRGKDAHAVGIVLPGEASRDIAATDAAPALASGHRVGIVEVDGRLHGDIVEIDPFPLDVESDLSLAEEGFTRLQADLAIDHRGEVAIEDLESEAVPLVLHPGDRLGRQNGGVAIHDTDQAEAIGDVPHQSQVVLRILAVDSQAKRAVWRGALDGRLEDVVVPEREASSGETRGAGSAVEEAVGAFLHVADGRGAPGAPQALPGAGLACLSHEVIGEGRGLDRLQAQARCLKRTRDADAHLPLGVTHIARHLDELAPEDDAHLLRAPFHLQRRRLWPQGNVQRVGRRQGALLSPTHTDQRHGPAGDADVVVILRPAVGEAEARFPVSRRAHGGAHVVGDRGRLLVELIGERGWGSSPGHAGEGP